MTGMTGGLSAEQVRGTEFSKAALGSRGYHRKSVDDFLALVARRLDGRGHLAAADVRGIAFPKSPLLQRGYATDEVDALVDAVVATLES